MEAGFITKEDKTQGQLIIKTIYLPVVRSSLRGFLEELGCNLRQSGSYDLQNPTKNLGQLSSSNAEVTRPLVDSKVAHSGRIGFIEFLWYPNPCRLMYLLNFLLYSSTKSVSFRCLFLPSSTILSFFWYLLFVILG